MKAFSRHSVNLSKDVFVDLLKVIKSRGIIKGPYIRLFEEKFTEYINCKYAIGVSSGRVALYLALKALGLNEGDEIIMPSYNFYAMPLMLKILKLRPVFVDVCPDTYNIDISLIEPNISKKTRAILVTHLFGQPTDMDQIISIAKDNSLKIIEDCAHGLGAEYKGQKVGSFGDIGIFSFGLGKNMPCFGGGMITTNNDLLWENLNDKFKSFSYPSQKSLWKNIFFTTLAYSVTKKRIFPYSAYPIIRLLDLYDSDLVDRIMEEGDIASMSQVSPVDPLKLTNLQAAIGIKQLKRVDGINEKNIRNANLLNKYLNGLRNIQIQKSIPNVKHIYLYYRIVVKNREMLRRKLLQRGIDTKRDDMSVCSSLEIFKEYKTNSCSISEELPRRSIEVPINPSLNKEDIIYIAEQIRQVDEEI